jgi:hypothetical protein
MIGSGMQQARKLQAEEAVEVVKNHVDGTGLSRGTSGAEARRARRAGVDARSDVDGGANGAPSGQLAGTRR